ncbi:hypothetical protein FOA52_012273 [Chlamydomonas sp. UWO 241]|nr:hypothetical protein FOA52_012273 [Chlamydomonas sp. UWO 241]
MERTGEEESSIDLPFSDIEELVARIRVGDLPDAPETSVTLEALSNALTTSKNSRDRLQLLRSEIERALAREDVQIERLHFALKTATNDEAYYRVVRRVAETEARK